MKPALAWMFIFDFYEQTHDRLPGHGYEGRKRLRKKRKAVIARWWETLPAKIRIEYQSRAEQQIRSYNDVIRENQRAVSAWAVEIQQKIEAYKRLEAQRQMVGRAVRNNKVIIQ